MDESTYLAAAYEVSVQCYWQRMLPLMHVIN
jgi:hypothetical protein